MSNGSYVAGITDIKDRFGNYVYPSYSYRNFYGSRASEDACVDSTHPGPPYRSGGNLLQYSWYANLEDVRAIGTYYSYNGGYRFRGGFYPTLTLADVLPGLSGSVAHSEALVPGSVYPSYSNAASYGATGWNKFRPGNPVADLGVFVGEFKDIPRMLQTSAKGFRSLWKSMGGSRTGFGPKSVANHWLNTQFGWMPFVNDLRKFYRTYTTMDAQISRIRNRNGRWCRTSGTVETSTTSSVVRSSATLSGHSPSLVSPLYKSPAGSFTVTRDNVVTVWFDGAFRYWIPGIASIQWEKRVVKELYGANPNPALLWELTPWSWLVDWCSNVGDVISNLDTGWAENLAAKYAYIMKSTAMKATMDSWCNLYSATLHDSWTFYSNWKSRQGASPFGFGLTDVDFSVRQWSILSALGISRLH